MTVLIGGGTGLVGSRLAHLLHDAGHVPRILTRDPGRAGSSRFAHYRWDVGRDYVDPEALAGATHVVNLAGAGIADARWTDARKEAIVRSRVATTALLARAIRAAGGGVEAFVSASAIGYYGDRGEAWVDEGADPGAGFLSASTVAWERALREGAEVAGVRAAWLRTGIALSPAGGALAEMLAPARLGLSGYFGHGRQWYSWIHLDDLCGVYLAALADARYEGPVNAVAPVPVRSRELARALARAVANPALAVPVPALALRLALGEMSRTVLDSTRVSSRRLVDGLGFDFAYPTAAGALAQLL